MSFVKTHPLFRYQVTMVLRQEKDYVPGITSNGTPWIAAPIATTSSGFYWFVWFFTSFSLHASGSWVDWTTSKDFIDFWQAQTCITRRAWGTGTFVRSTGHEVKSSNLARVKVIFQVKRSSFTCSDKWQADLCWSYTRRSFFAFQLHLSNVACHLVQ